jgi:hypothetical protein
MNNEIAINILAEVMTELFDAKAIDKKLKDHKIGKVTPDVLVSAILRSAATFGVNLVNSKDIYLSMADKQWDVVHAEQAQMIINALNASSIPDADGKVIHLSIKKELK